HPPEIESQHLETCGAERLRSPEHGLRVHRSAMLRVGMAEDRAPPERRIARPEVGLEMSVRDGNLHRRILTVAPAARVEAPAPTSAKRAMRELVKARIPTRPMKWRALFRQGSGSGARAVQATMRYPMPRPT